ncbi:MAG: 7-cyano-7-deazaguanine synthase QueC [Phycisphaeraceae bacterium]|nr:7-cyano-7-deazaguanine synthase QueC [Phycisphaeraceae bacterium]
MPPDPVPTTIVLLSGGLDSAVTLAIARATGDRCLALSFDYGQRHRIELEAAARVARALGAHEHRTVRIDLRAFGGSALTDEITVPRDRPAHAMAAGIPVTYVPARNTIFLSFALAWAEVTGAARIAIGVNAVDFSGYPDCRPAFIEAFERVANLGTRLGQEDGRSTSAPPRIAIEAPLIHLSKAAIIQRGLSLGVDFGLTISCYDPGAGGRPCGHCDACILRAAGFAAAGAVDPATR